MADSPETRMTIQSIQSILEVGAKLLAAIATLCVALSVIFDWGYLAALELTFSEVPTSLTDHTRSAVLWLPFVVSVMPLAVVVNLFLDRLHAKDLSEAKSREKDISAYVKSEAKNARLGLAVFTGVCFLSWLAFGSRARDLLVIGVISFWILIVIGATPHEHLGTRLSMLFRFCLVTLPMIPFALYVAGYNSGRKNISADQQFGTINVHSSDSQYLLKANVVRFFDKSVVVIGENHKVLLFKPDDIVRIEKAETVSTNKGLLCDCWHIVCPANNINAQ